MLPVKQHDNRTGQGREMVPEFEILQPGAPLKEELV